MTKLILMYWRIWIKIKGSLIQTTLLKCVLLTLSGILKIPNNPNVMNVVPRVNEMGAITEV